MSSAIVLALFTTKVVSPTDTALIDVSKSVIPVRYVGSEVIALPSASLTTSAVPA